MSGQDRNRWNKRYAAGAYGDRTHPSVLLERWLAEVTPGRALDVACGAGRNAIYLAGKGFAVDAVDISSAALARGAERADEAEVTVGWQEQDLDSWLPERSYHLIVVVRYADLALIERLLSALSPGGVLLVEAHLGGPLFVDAVDEQGERLVGGPGSERFRLQPGELAAACTSLQTLYCAEAQIADPDGRLMALSQFVGRAPSAS